MVEAQVFLLRVNVVPDHRGHRLLAVLRHVFVHQRQQHGGRRRAYQEQPLGLVRVPAFVPLRYFTASSTRRAAGSPVAHNSSSATRVTFSTVLNCVLLLHLPRTLRSPYVTRHFPLKHVHELPQAARSAVARAPWPQPPHAAAALPDRGTGASRRPRRAPPRTPLTPPGPRSAKAAPPTRSGPPSSSSRRCRRTSLTRAWARGPGGSGGGGSGAVVRRL